MIRQAFFICLSTLSGTTDAFSHGRGFDGNSKRLIMQFQHVCLEAAVAILPPHVVSSSDIETQLAPVYERLGLPAGRLELMTGIHERRFYAPGTKPGQISSKTAKLAVETAGLPIEAYGALIHGSVCRDQMEPATANIVHLNAGLSSNCMLFDVSNACLGLLNGMTLLASMIELGQIQAGIIVGTEVGRPLVESTIQSLIADETLTRQSIKYDIASLTIGSGSAAFVLCHEKISRHKTKLVGAISTCDTASHSLCAGGHDQAAPSAGLRMSTDSEALLHAGVNLAKSQWPTFLDHLHWEAEKVDKVITHQVGKAHRKLLLQSLDVPESKDYPVVEYMGNTGAVALPTALVLALENGHVATGEKIALLGIGSGLNCMMAGLTYQGVNVKSQIMK